MCKQIQRYLLDAKRPLVDLERCPSYQFLAAHTQNQTERQNYNEAELLWEIVHVYLYGHQQTFQFIMKAPWCITLGVCELMLWRLVSLQHLGLVFVDSRSEAINTHVLKC